MSRILITGSKGVVGSWLTKVLGERGHNVFGLDLSHDLGEVGWEHPMSKGKFYYSRCDVADFRQLERVFQKASPFDFVYHCAAEFGRWNGEDFYEQVWRSNAIGTKNIIRLQEKLGFKLIHFSSSEVYGDFDQVMSEDVMDKYEVKQLNDYALSKWVNEQQIRNSKIKHGTETVIVRLFNTYGPGEWYHPYRSVNCKFCYHLLFGIPIVIYRGHTRTSTYLEDTANALANIVDDFKSGEIYNIAGGEEHDIELLADLVLKHSGAKKSLLHYQESEILTTKNKKVDASRAAKQLNLKQTVDLNEGIKRTIQWMKEYYRIN
jgi:dTDP-glucose 4,6-dehydratase